MESAVSAWSALLVLGESCECLEGAVSACKALLVLEEHSKFMESAVSAWWLCECFGSALSSRRAL